MVESGLSREHGPDALDLRELETCPADPVLELVKTCLGEGTLQRSPEVWNWKHRRNPFGKSIGRVAFEKDEAIGLRPFLRWQFRYGSKRISAFRAVDTATHPRFRRQGLFRMMTLAGLSALEESGGSLVFNTPNSRSGKGYLGMGWRALKRLEVLFRPCLGPQTLMRFSRRSGAAGRGKLGMSVQTLLEKAGLEGLLESWTESWPGVQTDRHLEYLRWRFSEIPGLSYFARFIETPQGDRSALIGRREARLGLQGVRICEYLFDPDGDLGRESCASRVLRELARCDQVDYMVAMASRGTPEYSALRRSGFMPIPTRRRLMALKLREGDDEQLEPRGWRLTLGDLEVF